MCWSVNYVNALISAERCGPALRAVKDGEDLNLVLADAIGNNVRGPGDGELPRSLDAAFAARERITGQHADPRKDTRHKLLCGVLAILLNIVIRRLKVLLCGASSVSSSQSPPPLGYEFFVGYPHPRVSLPNAFLDVRELPALHIKVGIHPSLSRKVRSRACAFPSSSRSATFSASSRKLTVFLLLACFCIAGT